MQDAARKGRKRLGDRCVIHGGLSRGKNKPALPRDLRQAHGRTALQRKAFKNIV